MTVVTWDTGCVRLVDWAVGCLQDRLTYLDCDFDPYWPKSLRSHTQSLRFFVVRAEKNMTVVRDEVSGLDFWKTILDVVSDELRTIRRFLDFKDDILLVVMSERGERTPTDKLFASELGIMAVVYARL